MIQANPNAPGCEGAQATPDQTIDQNNILIDKHISLGGYSFPVNTSLEAKVVYAANRLPAYTVGDKELLSFVLPLSFASSEEEGTFFTIDVLYFGLKKGKGVYGVGETQLVTNDIRRGLR